MVCIAKGMKPHLVLNDEEKQQRFDDDGGLHGGGLGDCVVGDVVGGVDGGVVGDDGAQV